MRRLLAVLLVGALALAPLLGCQKKGEAETTGREREMQRKAYEHGRPGGQG